MIFRWNLHPAGRALPPPWALQRNDATADLEVTNVQRAPDPERVEVSPKLLGSLFCGWLEFYGCWSKPRNVGEAIA